MANSTEERLAQALKDKMRTTPIDRIRVVELAESVGISKQAFYNHFTDKYDLMEFCYRQMFAPTFGRTCKYYPFSESCRDLYKVFHQNEAFLRNAFASRDVRGLTKVMFENTREMYRRYLEEQGVKDTGGVAFMLDLFTHGCVEMTKEWVHRGMDTPDEELIGLWLRSFPAELAGYFK